ncbi:MAG: hypothetical protein K5656_08655 [Lachnospiraceae bacterium]|nr:hypothetical protein [Lachnospiraceae bacterium]
MPKANVKDGDGIEDLGAPGFVNVAKEKDNKAAEPIVEPEDNKAAEPIVELEDNKVEIKESDYLAVEKILLGQLDAYAKYCDNKRKNETVKDKAFYLQLSEKFTSFKDTAKEMIKNAKESNEKTNISDFLDNYQKKLSEEIYNYLEQDEIKKSEEYDVYVQYCSENLFNDEFNKKYDEEYKESDVNSDKVLSNKFEKFAFSDKAMEGIDEIADFDLEYDDISFLFDQRKINSNTIEKDKEVENAYNNGIMKSNSLAISFSKKTNLSFGDLCDAFISIDEAVRVRDKDYTLLRVDEASADITGRGISSGYIPKALIRTMSKIAEGMNKIKQVNDPALRKTMAIELAAYSYTLLTSESVLADGNIRSCRLFADTILQSFGLPAHIPQLNERVVPMPINAKKSWTNSRAKEYFFDAVKQTSTIIKQDRKLNSTEWLDELAKPSPITNYYAKKSEGEYAFYSSFYIGLVTAYDSHSIVAGVDQAMADKVNDLSLEMMQFNAHFMEEHYSIRSDVQPLKAESFYLEIREKLDEYMRVANKVLKDIKSSLTGDKSIFKDYFDLMLFNINLDEGKYTDTMINSLFFGRLNGMIGTGPKLGYKEIKDSKGKVIGKEINFDEVISALSEPDGSGYLTPYMKLVKDTLDLRKNEVAKVEHDRIGWTKESKDEFSKRQIEVYKSFVSHFYELKKVVLDNPGIYDSNLENFAIHAVDYDRDYLTDVSQMEGQIRAYENGWQLEELPLLGVIHEVSTTIEKRLKKISVSLTSDIDKLRKADLSLVTLNKELEEIKKNTSGLKPEELDREIKNKENEIKRINSKIDEYRDDIEKREVVVKSINKVITTINGLKAKYWDLKITDNTNKKLIFKDIKDTFTSLKDDLVFEQNKKFGDTYIYTKLFDQLDAFINTGLNRDLSLNDFAKDKLIDVIELYGPQTSNEASVKYDANELNFTTKEIAFLSMMATLNAKDKIIDLAGDNDYSYEEIVHLNAHNWIEDVSANKVLDSNQISKYNDIIEFGRKNAYEAMKLFQTGQKKALAEIVYNGLLYISRKARDFSAFKESELHNYAMLSCFTDLLTKDGHLYDEFMSINNSMSANNRINLEEIYAIKNISKIRMDAVDNANNYKKLVKSGRAIDKDDQVEKHRYLNRRAIYERRLIISKTQDELINFANLLMNNSAELKDKANNNVLNYAIESGSISKLMLYMGSEEGMKELTDFSDRLISSYGVRINKDRLLIGNDQVINSHKYKAEIQSFAYQMINKQILKELKANALSIEDMRKLTTEYIYNNYIINELKWSVEHDLPNTLLDISEANVEYNKRREDIKLSINKFVANMDMSDGSEVFAEALEANSLPLYENAKNIVTIVDTNIWKENNKPGRNQITQVTSLDNAVSMLKRSDKGVFKGSTEYKNILLDLIKLNEDQKKAASESVNPLCYDAKAYAIREKDLIDRLSKYANRKETELNIHPEGKKSATALDRMNSAKESIKIIKKRLEEDLRRHTITQEALKDVGMDKSNLEIPDNKESKFNERPARNNMSGMEMLEYEISEENYQFVKHLTTYFEEKEGNLDHKNTMEDIKSCFKHAIHNEILKKAFKPQQNDDQKTKDEKNIKLKTSIKKGISAKQAELYDQLLSSDYGQKMISIFMHDLSSLSKEDLTGAITHNIIIACSNEALRQCFDNEYRDFKKYKKLAIDYAKGENTSDEAKNAKSLAAKKIVNVDNLISLANQISSNAIAIDSKSYQQSKKQFLEIVSNKAQKQTGSNKAPIAKK